MNSKVFTEKAPAPIGPYSQAVKTTNMLFCSGVIGVDPQTGDFTAADISGQTRQIIRNIDELLKTAGYSVGDVVKTTCFLAEMADFSAFNKIYAEYFTSEPARSCIAAKELPKGALAEIEIIAAK